MDYALHLGYHVFCERVGVLKQYILVLMGLLMLSSSFATNSSVNITNVSSTLGGLQDSIIGSDVPTGMGLAFIGFIIVIVAVLALMSSGMGLACFSVVIIPLVLVLATGGYLPSFVAPLVFIVLGIVWAMIIGKVVGVR
jgi:hypothetical protein